MISLLELFKSNNNQLEVRVTPNAKFNKVLIDEDDSNTDTESRGVSDYKVRVYVTVTPEDGKANSQVIKLLAKELKIPKSKINIIKGLKSKQKVVVINQ